MSQSVRHRLLGLAVSAAALAGGHGGALPAGYAPVTPAVSLDTIRVKALARANRVGRSVLGLGAAIPGYLSSRGLPPIRGRFTVTDTGLVFHSDEGAVSRFPLIGPRRETAGRQRRASTISLAYIDDGDGRPVYVFRIDAGVFETEIPGPLLDVAAHPAWLDSLGPSDWAPERPLVDGSDSVAVWSTARRIATSPYADSLYGLLGRPQARVGLIGRRGRIAGRLGEYNYARDSLALDPGRMIGEAQLRHALAHELGHRWQARGRGQLGTLWLGVPPIRDPKRYGYDDPLEHQAEAIAFAINFLQTTAGSTESSARSLSLLDHYELLVPGTRMLVRYFALQPIYWNHPLRSVLTTGR